MAEITAKLVKELRDRTQLPMMECKKALAEADGDIEKAEEFLRKSGALAAAKKAGRETAEGRIAIYISDDGKSAGAVEVRCETAPVANNELFIKLCKDIAKVVANIDENTVKTVDDLLNQNLDGKTVKELIEETINRIRENMQIAKFKKLTGGYFASYEHHNGQVATVLQIECTEDAWKNDRVRELTRDLCMHITAMNPLSVSRDEIPADILEKEKEIIKAQVAEQAKGKPENIIEKIMMGKLNKWFAENVLLEQMFVKDDKKKVKQIIDEVEKETSNPIKVKSFLRYEVGGRE